MKTVIKSVVTFAFAFILVFNMASAQAWTLDNSHSAVEFKVAHMVISKTSGNFGKFSINFEQGKEDFSDSKVTASIEVASVNTENEKRDGHLKTGDFFDAEKYPTIDFKSTKFARNKDGSFAVTGDLTIKGVTKTVTFDVTYGGTIKDPWGSTRSGWNASTTIDRTEFGLEYNSVMDTGGLMIGEEVEINVPVEMIQK